MTLSANLSALTNPEWNTIMPIESLQSFEQDYSLIDLLQGINTDKLFKTIEQLLDTAVCVIDTQKQCLYGDPAIANDKSSRVSIHGDLEPIGFLYADCPQQSLTLASSLVQQVLKSNHRYLMASQIHMQTQRDDFEELQRRHAALELSEAKYKQLAESLEIKVKQQVKKIQSAQTNLYKNEKLASVGRLAAGVAHEINNPIGFIRSNLSTLGDYLPALKKLHMAIEQNATREQLQTLWQQNELQYLYEDGHDIIHESTEGIDRVAAIIKDLKGFSGVDEIKLELSNINDIIEQMLHISMPQFQDKLSVIKMLGEIPKTICQPAELGQVFLNLLLNAADAIPQQGKVVFKTSLHNSHIVIDVKDNGTGISEQNLPHVFDPFFTTKEIGNGIGLGLTVCHNIIQSHKGNIKIKSTQQQGTHVHIILPIVTSTSEQYVAL